MWLISMNVDMGVDMKKKNNTYIKEIIDTLRSK